jgi:hypothetical protein
MVGIITNRQIGPNRDGDKSRLLLQVQMVDDDMRTVELVTQAGEDTNPANGCRVVVINVPGYKVAVAVTDDLTPEVDPGEKEIYSTDNPATAKQARTRWKSDGTIVHNLGTTEAARKGDTAQLTMQQADILALATALLATGLFVPTGNPPVPAGPVVFVDGEITSGTSEVLLP